MWGRFRRKEPDIGALQKALGRFRRGTRATRREQLVIVYRGNAVRLGFIVLLILVTISLARWLLRRRTREEEATLTSPPPEEGLEGVDAAGLSAEGEPVVMPGGLPLSEEDTTVKEEPPPAGEERPEMRGL
jgi:hypothetical protein